MPKIEESQGAVAVATGSADNIPSELLKSQLLEGWRAIKGVTVLHGYSYLAASQEAAGRVVAVVDGTFNRQVFRAVQEEALKAGAKSEKVQVYCEIATYTGSGIDITRFEDVGMSNLDRKLQNDSNAIHSELAADGIADAILVHEQDGVVVHRFLPSSEAHRTLDAASARRSGGAVFVVEDGLGAEMYYSVSPDVRSRVDEAKHKLRRDLHWQDVMDRHGVPLEKEVRISVARAMREIMGEEILKIDMRGGPATSRSANAASAPEL